MRVFDHPDQRLHDPRFFLMRGKVRPGFEVAGRLAALRGAVDAMGLAVSEPAIVAPAILATVHDPAYLDFLREVHAAWSALPNAGDEVVPNIHPTPEMLAQGATPPTGPVGQAGWYVPDTGSPIGAGTWPSALAAASCAVAAAKAVTSGERCAYALCRPPGHHAYAARAGGHCFLNNAAIAAQTLRDAGAARIAILDIDVHHGNGTQGIFYDRPDVLTISIHGDPNGLYPWFVGHARERGAGAGEGANRNLPLAHGTADEAWLQAIGTGLADIARFSPDALVLALGFDAWEGEPLGALGVTQDGFARAAALVSAAKLPSVITQEGGYAIDALPGLLTRFMQGWAG